MRDQAYRQGSVFYSALDMRRVFSIRLCAKRLRINTAGRLEANDK